MQITIDKAKTLKDISDAFQQQFPNLKLIFFSEKHAVGEGSSLWDTLNPSLLLEDFADIPNPEAISINGHLKVATLEQQFQSRYGIGVQVARREGDEWVQTTRSDEWTLSQQNQRAHV